MTVARVPDDLAIAIEANSVGNNREAWTRLGLPDRLRAAGTAD